jgi:hypothetical protein
MSKDNKGNKKPYVGIANLAADKKKKQAEANTKHRKELVAKLCSVFK